MTIPAKLDGLVLTISLPRDEAERLAPILAKHNGHLSAELKAPRRPRSTGEDSQNHHLNAHIADIARQAGCTHECAKYAVKVLAVELFGYPAEAKFGQLFPKPERLTDVEECAILIEAAHMFAADYGYDLKE